MAITVTTAPPALAYTRNPIPVKATSNSLVTTAEARPYLDLAFTTTSPVNADALTWTITDPETGETQAVAIIAATSPDATGAQIPTNPGDPVDDYAAVVLSYLQTNPFLNTYYTVTLQAGATSTNATIRIQARTADDGLDFAGISGSLTGTTATPTNTTTAKVYRTAFKLWLFLFLENPYLSTSWERVPIDAYRDENDVFRFDLGPYLDAYCGQIASVPAHDLAAPDFFISQAVLQYYLQYAEQYQAGGDDAPEFKTQSLSLTRYRALAGGLNPLEYPDNTDFITQLPTTKRLLTWWPDQKEVAPDQPEFISWLNAGATAKNIGLRVLVNFTDGTSETITPIPADTNHTVKSGELVHVPVGYTALDLAAVDVAKTVLDWTVTLIDDTGTPVLMSVSRTYILDSYAQRQTRYLIWLNSLGGLDTLRCTGQRSITRRVSKETYTKYLADDYTALAGQADALLTDDQYEHRLDSGFMSAAERRAAQDVLTSRHVFLVQDDRMERVLVTPGSVVVDVDNEDLAALSINYRPTFAAGPTTPAQLTP